MTPFPTYEVQDPARTTEWTTVPSANAWDAVRRYLRLKKYEPATFGETRLFLVRFSPEKAPTEIRVGLPPPRIEVQIHSGGRWSPPPPEVTHKRLHAIARRMGWEPPPDGVSQ